MLSNLNMYPLTLCPVASRNLEPEMWNLFWFVVFKRLLFRGKLALGITANFVNEQKQADNDIDEIGGIFKVFKPDFFAKLKKQGDIDLENFVYFKNDTHYFVYTAKKNCLLKKGVILSVSVIIAVLYFFW